jgi:Co/Zn/Cd efflux system component
MKSAPVEAANLTSVRRAVVTVASLNLGYFGIEFAVARAIGSVSLFADSIDFLEDATVNGLILIAFGWSARRRSIVGMLLAVVLFAPGVATLWTAWEKFSFPIPPAPLPLTLTGLGALAINLFCAVLLARVRTHSGSLTRAAFLSARNDTLANVAIIAAGAVTAATLSAWPDLFVGIGIFGMPGCLPTGLFGCACWSAMHLNDAAHGSSWHSPDRVPSARYTALFKGAWPFGLVEAIWALVALRRWHYARISRQGFRRAR